MNKIHSITNNKINLYILYFELLHYNIISQLYSQFSQFIYLFSFLLLYKFM